MVFDIINRQHDDTICFVSKPTRIMYPAHGLNEKVFYSKCKNISRIIVALNVGCDENGTYVFNDKKTRNTLDTIRN